jgi:hypothetical protein
VPGLDKLFIQTMPLQLFAESISKFIVGFGNTVIHGLALKVSRSPNEFTATKIGQNVPAVTYNLGAIDIEGKDELEEPPSP